MLNHKSAFFCWTFFANPHKKNGKRELKLKWKTKTRKKVISESRVDKKKREEKGADKWKSKGGSWTQRRNHEEKHKKKEKPAHAHKNLLSARLLRSIALKANQYCWNVRQGKSTHSQLPKTKRTKRESWCNVTFVFWVHSTPSAFSCLCVQENRDQW